MPVTKIAQRDGLAIAVNGNLFQAKDYQSIMGHKFYYFEGNWAKVSGWAMSDGTAYSPGPVARGFPSFVVNDRGEIRFGSFERLPADVRQVVSGVFQIVTNGQITVYDDPPVTEGIDAPAPHTVVGVDRSGKKLILFVVDGRRPDYSVGMQMHRIAEQLVSRGVWNALVLDGGGSSTFAMRDENGKVNLVNHPSDGHDFPMGVSIERSVANALGVIIDPPGAPATQPTQP
jgi:exopolysaccharide biosynthesis protein